MFWIAVNRSHATPLFFRTREVYYGHRSLYTHMIELIAFLGNFGSQYARNRHNAAWLFAEELPWVRDLSWQMKYKGAYASLDASTLAQLAQTRTSLKTVDSDELPARLHLIFPHTYMNLSGTSVRELASFFKIPPESILVVHDELELAPGTVSFKFSGGLGGHNGLRSMRDSFGTADFWRLRIGIGRPDHKDIAGYVLSNFSLDESILLSSLSSELEKALLLALVRGPDRLLPAWNKRVLDSLEIKATRGED